MVVVETAVELATPVQVRGLLRWSKLIGLDLETTGLDPRKDRIRLLSVSDGNRTLVMDCFEHDVRQVLPWLSDKILVAHHATFDLEFLWHAGLRDLPETICTYLAAQVLTAGETAHGFPKLGLGECCKRWLQTDLNKELQQSDWSGELTADQMAYAARDAAVLLPLFKVLGEQLEKHRLDRVADVEMRALLAFVWMSRAGVPFDRGGWLVQADQVQTDLLQVTADLNERAPNKGVKDLFGEHETWNWNSPDQVATVLERVGYRVDTTCDAQLAAIDHPIATMLRKHRELSKALGTYGHDWLEHVADDGRVYPSWRQIGSAAGRTSCKEPNMQQIPRGSAYRACVRAPEGRVLIKADLSQIELRLAAKVAREKNMLAIYRKRQDIHNATACMIYGVETPTKQQRQIAKSANFGLLYGMSANGFRVYVRTNTGIEMTEEQAEQSRTKFFQAYPGLAAWHKQVKARHANETRTLLDRRRLLPAEAPDTWRLNTPVQGSGADGLKIALGTLWRRRDEVPGAFPVLAVHDEIVIEASQEQASLAAVWVEEAMVDAMRDMLDPVPVEVDVKIVETWGG